MFLYNHVKLVDMSTSFKYKLLVAKSTSRRFNMLDRFKTFTLLITNINRSIRKIKTEEMAEYNLKSIHISCLYY